MFISSLSFLPKRFISISQYYCKKIINQSFPSTEKLSDSVKFKDKVYEINNDVQQEYNEYFSNNFQDSFSNHSFQSPIKSNQPVFSSSSSLSSSRDLISTSVSRSPSLSYHPSLSSGDDLKNIEHEVELPPDEGIMEHLLEQGRSNWINELNGPDPFISPPTCTIESIINGITQFDDNNYNIFDTQALVNVEIPHHIQIISPSQIEQWPIEIKEALKPASGIDDVSDPDIISKIQQKYSKVYPHLSPTVRRLLIDSDIEKEINSKKISKTKDDNDYGDNIIREVFHDFDDINIRQDTSDRFGSMGETEFCINRELRDMTTLSEEKEGWVDEPKFTKLLMNTCVDDPRYIHVKQFVIARLYQKRMMISEKRRLEALRRVYQRRQTLMSLDDETKWEYEKELLGSYSAFIVPSEELDDSMFPTSQDAMTWKHKQKLYNRAIRSIRLKKDLKPLRPFWQNKSKQRFGLKYRI